MTANLEALQARVVDTALELADAVDKWVSARPPSANFRQEAMHRALVAHRQAKAALSKAKGTL